MRILHVVPTYLPAYRYGGPIYSVHGLCKALAVRGHSVDVFTTNVDGPGDSNVPVHIPVSVDGVTVRYHRSRVLRRSFWSPSMTRTLKEAISTFDLVHLHSVFLWPTATAARRARRRDVPYLVSPRGMLEKELIEGRSRWKKTLWLRLVERRTLANAAAIHVTSRREELELESLGFEIPRTVIVPNGVDAVDVDSEQSVAPLNKAHASEGGHVLFLGRLSRKKGLDRLIPAIAQVPDVSLVIAGNDEENYRAVAAHLIREHKLEQRVHLVGPVAGWHKRELLRTAMVLVLPSYSENFGNSVLEAMAIGCPVIVTPEVGLADTVGNHGAGLVVKGEPCTIASALKRLISDPQERARMGENGRRTVAKCFTWPSVARRMEAVYEEILRSSSPAKREERNMWISRVP